MYIMNCRTGDSVIIESTFSTTPPQLCILVTLENTLIRGQRRLSNAVLLCVMRDVCFPVRGLEVNGFLCLQVDLLESLWHRA
jgi:hypothetical protein